MKVEYVAAARGRAIAIGTRSSRRRKNASRSSSSGRSPRSTCSQAASTQHVVASRDRGLIADTQRARRSIRGISAGLLSCVRR
jgi:hypothetical protein